MRARWWWTAGLGLIAAPAFGQAPPPSSALADSAPLARWAAPPSSAAPSAPAAPPSQAPQAPSNSAPSAAVAGYPLTPPYVGPSYAGVSYSAGSAANAYPAAGSAANAYASPAGYVATMAARDPSPTAGRGDIVLTHGVHSVSTISPPSAAAEGLSSRRPGWEASTLDAPSTAADERPPALPPENTAPAAATPAGATAAATAYAQERWLDGQGWERPHPVPGGAPLDPSAPRVVSNRADQVSYRPSAAQQPRDPRLAQGARTASRGRPADPYDPYRRAAAYRAASRQQPPVDEDDPVGPPMPRPDQLPPMPGGEGLPPGGGPGYGTPGYGAPGYGPPYYGGPGFDPQFGPPPYGLPYGPPGPPQKCDPSHLYLGDCDPRCVDPRPVPPKERDWFTRVEFVYWKMPRPRPETISIDTATNATVLNTDGLEFDFRGGPRLTIGRFIDPNDSLDFRYTSLFREASVEGASSGGTLNAAFPTNASGYSISTFQDATSQRIAYGTEFHDMQLVFTHYFESKSNVIFQAQGGFRYFILNQQFTFDSTSSAGTGQYQVFTHNHVFGPEFGGTAMLPVGDATYVFASGGGGLTLNATSSGTDVTANSAALFHRDSHEWTLGTTANLALGVRQNFGPRTEIRLAYELMFVSGVATAPGQIDLVNTVNSSRLIDSQQQLFLNGLTAGATFRW